MTHSVRSWRPAWRVLALALVIAAIPLPCLAGDDSQPVAKPGIRASAEKAAAAARLSDAAAQAKPQPTGAAASGSFFKSPAGIAVIGVLAAGAGFALYSASHDRIHSVVRQNQ